MPIRINLLAEQQAAEEMRRRDPLKRAILLGSLLTALMLVWIGLTQVNVGAARGELTDLEARLKKLDDQARAVKDKQATTGELEDRLKALEKYAANRFYWASLLDSLQTAAVEKVRLMEVRGEHRYTGGDIGKLFNTNINVTYTPPPPFWKFWASARAKDDINTLVGNVVNQITNAPPFSTNTIPYTAKFTPASTNLNDNRVSVKSEFTTVPWAQESILVEIRGRDYSSPPGAAIDQFTQRLRASSFFQEWLDPAAGFRFTERPPQPRPDPQDPVNPGALFVPFTIEGRLKERTFTP